METIHKYRADVEELIGKNWRNRDIAAKVGCHTSYVSHIRTELKYRRINIKASIFEKLSDRELEQFFEKLQSWFKNVAFEELQSTLIFYEVNPEFHDLLDKAGMFD